MYVLGIDCGWVHTALCLCDVDEEGNMEAVDFALINLNDLRCGADCKLSHDGHVVHKIAHVFVMYKRFFDTADKVFIERQPVMVGSMLHVEALLYDRLKDKAELVSPMSMHKHFSLPKNDYDGRKARVDEIAGPHLQHLQGYKELTRTHDIGDGYLMCRLHADKIRDRYMHGQKIAKIAVDLNKFRYTAPFRRR